MISNAIECFNTKIERLENNIGTPHGVVVATGDERIEGVFAGVPAWAMPTIVAEGDCFSERDVETETSRNRRCHLCDFECVCEPGALMVVGKNKDLGFSRKPTEGW